MAPGFPEKRTKDIAMNKSGDQAEKKYLGRRRVTNHMINLQTGTAALKD